MPNYKEMYLTMMRASEKAINILIEAQQKCEDMYIRDEPCHPGDRRISSEGIHIYEVIRDK